MKGSRASTLIGLLALLAGPAFAAPTDLSGVYDCTGEDASEGAYNGTVTMERVAAHSVGRNVAYRFRLDVPGYGSYPGEAVSEGGWIAITFAHTDPSTKDYGTGIARVFRRADGRLAFHKFYYEAAFKGGNHGTETCVRRR